MVEKSLLAIVHTPPVNVAEYFEVQKEYNCFELILPENSRRFY